MLTFQAPVRSEDDDQEIEVELLTDYGFLAPDGRPFAAIQDGNNVTASHFNDTSRVVSMTWIPTPLATPCHRFTLMVSHNLVRGNGCPADLSDSSFLSWNVVVCSDSNNCPPAMFDPDSACGNPANDNHTCPATSGAT